MGEKFLDLDKTADVTLLLISYCGFNFQLSFKINMWLCKQNDAMDSRWSWWDSKDKRNGYSGTFSDCAVQAGPNTKRLVILFIRGEECTELQLIHLSFINMIMAPPEYKHTLSSTIFTFVSSSSPSSPTSTAEERQPEVSRRSMLCIYSTIQTLPPQCSSVLQGHFWMSHIHTHTIRTALRRVDWCSFSSAYLCNVIRVLQYLLHSHAWTL